MTVQAYTAARAIRGGQRHCYLTRNVTFDKVQEFYAILSVNVNRMTRKTGRISAKFSVGQGKRASNFRE